MDGYLLDACALIAYLNDEDGADVVDELFENASEGDATVFISTINLLEVYYGMYRELGYEKATEILSDIQSLPITAISDFSLDAMLEAGRLKAVYKVSLADSIALGIASVSGYSLVTADHHEMGPIDTDPDVTLFWIR